MINYDIYDNRMQKDKREKVAFANQNGYKYYTEMLHHKHSQGMTGGQIARWSNDNTVDFHSTTSSLDYTLRVMGVFTLLKKQRKSNTVSVKKEPTLKVDIKICSCCGLNTVYPGNRMLCKNCYQGKSATVRHGNTNFIGF